MHSQGTRATPLPRLPPEAAHMADLYSKDGQIVAPIPQPFLLWDFNCPPTGACIHSAWADLGTTEEEMLSLLREGCERQYNFLLVLSGCSHLEPSHAPEKKPMHPARARGEGE